MLLKGLGGGFTGSFLDSAVNGNAVVEIVSVIGGSLLGAARFGAVQSG